MSHLQRHIPLRPPLVAGLAAPGCRACVVVPARNEEMQLARTLGALARQVDLSGRPLDPSVYEVLLLLNNCTDGSEAEARAFSAAHPALCLHVICLELPAAEAHVGTARRLLMDTAYERLRGERHPHCAILSTDGDTAVAPDWVARNLQALEQGADAVGGVIRLFPAEEQALATSYPAVYAAYCRDREFQREVARLEALLDPDPADPWPRHLHHFGASLGCTPGIYALAGGLPPVKPLEDVAFVDALRRVGARLRHCPDTAISTSARMDGRAEVGLSGQLRHWLADAELGRPHLVDSAAWLLHRFRTLQQLRRLNEATHPDLTAFPKAWHPQLQAALAAHLPTPRFLELLDCNLLVDETFRALAQPRQSPITDSIRAIRAAIATLEHPVAQPVLQPA